MKDKENVQKRMPLWGKISISIGLLIVSFIAFFLIIDTPNVSRYKQFVWKNMNRLLNDHERTDDTDMRRLEDVEFADLERKVPFNVPRPSWLPEGYELDYIDYSYSGDFHTITYNYLYEDDEKKYIFFAIDSDVIGEVESNIVVDYEKVTVGELTVFLLTFGNPTWQTIYMNEQGFRISISTLEDRETLLKIIENMS